MEMKPERETTLGSLPFGGPEKASQIKTHVDGLRCHRPLLKSEQNPNSGQLCFPTQAFGLEEESMQRKLTD